MSDSSVTSTTTSQNTALQVMTALTSFISLVAIFPHAKKIYFGGENQKHLIAQQYFGVLLIMNGITAVMYGIGRFAMLSYGFCQFQAFVVQTGGVAIQIFEAYIAVKMYYLIVKRTSPEKLLLTLKRDVIITYIFTGCFALIFLFTNQFGAGDGAPWCWIIGSDVTRIDALYVSLIISYVVSWVAYAYIGYSIKGSDDENLAEAEIQVKNKLESYHRVYMFCWSWGLLNVIVSSSTKRPCFATQLLLAIFQPMQGFLNAMVYTNVFTNVYKKYFASITDSFMKEKSLIFQKNILVDQAGVLHVDRKSIAGRMSIAGDMDISAAAMLTRSQLAEIFAMEKSFAPDTTVWDKRGGSPLTERERLQETNLGSTQYKPKFYSIFTSTFNLGEAKAASLHTNLADWLPPHYDIYAIGMQEALDLPSLRDIMWNHLGGPTQYVMFKEEIGSDNTSLGYHGYIAMTVFVRKGDVDCGNVREVVTGSKSLATGRNLGIAKATNKGAIGIPFQIHDTSITFVTAHLPSDNKGVRKLLARNKSSQDVLSQLILAPADLGWSAHKQTDHFIFTGDLNYRIFNESFAGGGQVCEDVSRAAKVEKEYINQRISLPTGTWREKRALLLRNIKHDANTPTAQEVAVLLSAQKGAAAEWSHVLKADELKQAMSSGAVFSGFEEPLIAFAPSYKRKVGHLPGCGDYTNPIIVFDGFSNTEGMESDESKGVGVDEESNGESPRRERANIRSMKEVSDNKKKMRPPSYTDRILVHSLPNRTRRLSLQAYDITEAMLVSDHRPVSMAMSLEVNSAVIYPVNFVDKLDEKNVDKALGTTIIGKERYYLFELNITDLKILLLAEQQDKKDTGDDVSDSNAAGGADAASRLSTPNRALDTLTDLEGNEFAHVKNPMMNESNLQKLNYTGSDVASPSGKMEDIPIQEDSVSALPIRGSKSKRPISGIQQLEYASSTDQLDDVLIQEDAISALPQLPKKPVKPAKQGRRSSVAAAIKYLLQGDQPKKTGPAPINVSRVKVTFPLPGKDPLQPFRRIHEIAKAFELEKKSILDSFQEVARNVWDKKYTKEQLDSVQTDYSSLINSVSEFSILKCEHNTNLAMSEQGNDIEAGNNGSKASLEVELHSDTLSCAPMRLMGCIVPELGTHVLIALANAAGETQGEITISLSHLVDLKSNSSKSAYFGNIPVSRGGELRGKASGKFSLSLLTIVSTSDNPAMAKMLV